MKIDIRKIKFDEEASYKVLNYEKCCDLLIECDSICLNSEMDENTGVTEYSVKLIRTDDWRDPYEDDCNSSLTYAYYTIGYCPFCQEEIRIVISEEIDITEAYLDLKRQREEKWKLCQKTDSKKKENKLRMEVRELDRKINEFYISDGFTTIRLREDMKEFNNVD